ncbi:LytR/AlgR family response regulator transcription factor [Pedobacter frigoris]|uniref:Response regulator n=1 Tax=Pedobacter frigoris TaxID=2571272 RepID=A0A4U1CNP5_9SPHI|nr:LytTR family transcriptional regulator DNA-binding domain-containing protein [Pedobacter frigoris]TKC09073.1 response regulator [Pedobacter frigoris]
MKYTCIIIRDKRVSNSSFNNYLNKDPNIEVSGTFTSATEAIRSIDLNDKPDFIFVDIQDPSVETIDALTRLKRYTKALVFISSDKAQHQQVTDDNTIHLIPLPIKSKQQYDEILKEIRMDIATNTFICMTVKLKKGSNEFTSCYFDDITYIESEGNYLHIHTDNNTYSLLSSLLDIEEQVKYRTDLVRIHKSFVISIHAIEYFIKPLSVKIRGLKIPVPVGRSYQKKYHEAVKHRKIQLDQLSDK